MKWSTAIATPAHLGDAVEEASEAIQHELGELEPDLVLAFVSAEHSDRYASLPGELRAKFPNAVILGCSAGGVIGGGRELEREPALALTAAVLPGVTLTTFTLDGKHWPTAPVPPEDEPDFVILADPLSCDAQALVQWFDGTYPDSTKIGGLASGGSAPGEFALFSGDESHRTGAIALALSGNIEVDTVVAQGCRPIGHPMFVTRHERNVILELDSQPALAALEILHAELSPEDQKLFRNSLHIGIVMRESCEVYEHGDFLVRNIIGLDPELGAVAVNLLPGDNQVVQFHLRDAATSAEDLSEMLSRHQYAEPAGALLFSCLGRGKGLYGEPDHDSAMFREHLGPVPLGGFFGNGEIGPVQGQTFVHGYTSSFGLFRPKRIGAA